MSGDLRTIRAITEAERPLLVERLRALWGSTQIISRGRMHDAATLPGFIAFVGDEAVGLVTYHLAADTCEIVTLDSWREQEGVGSSLLIAVRSLAQQEHCQRLWLITTNDNTYALRFYQRRGFILVALYAGAIDQSRAIKPEIPLLGRDNIPIRDEIELEWPLF